MLWNRLGSSLSNGNHPEAALGAYREALQLRPTYTRAIYNVGVNSCITADKRKALLDSHQEFGPRGASATGISYHTSSEVMYNCTENPGTIHRLSPL